jgi:hypothetical protein
MLVLSDRWGWKAAAAAELVGMADAFGESAARYAPLKPTWGVGERRGCLLFLCSARKGRAPLAWNWNGRVLLREEGPGTTGAVSRHQAGEMLAHRRRYRTHGEPASAAHASGARYTCKLLDFLLEHFKTKGKFHRVL